MDLAEVIERPRLREREGERLVLAPGREESLYVRMVALAIGVWTALTLGWIGSPWWTWMGGVALLCTGHAVSRRPSSSRIPIRTIIVGVGVIGSLALSPKVVSQAAGGDWLPAAHFLLLYQVITSFELRSRSGLYASIGLSGAVMFFASQHAVDPFFGVFLTGFVVLVLAFSRCLSWWTGSATSRSTGSAVALPPVRSGAL